MKLGPKLRKKRTLFLETLRKMFGILDYSFWLLFDPSKFKIIKNVNNIMYVLINKDKGNVGGDFCTLGILNNLKKNYPNTRIRILADKKTISYLGEVPGIEMVEYKGKTTFDNMKKDPPQAILLPEVYHIDNNILNNKILFIPYRIRLCQYSIPVNPLKLFLYLNTKLFLTRVIHYIWGKDHMVEILYKQIETLGFKFNKKELIFYCSSKEEKKIGEFLNKNKIKKYIILHPGGKNVVETLKKGKWPPHLWPLKRYAKIANYLSKKGYKILITGTSEENYLASEIKRLSGVEIISCCGKFSIRECGALLKRAKLLISTDTGIVHVAYQTKVPIVELMGPTYPKVYGAWPSNSKRNIILFDDGPCAYSMRKDECPEDIICMDKISEKDVIKAAEKLLKLKN